MSEFIRSVVNEILVKNKSVSSEKPQVIQQKNTGNTASYGSPATLHGIQRPNYQKEKMKKRLSPLEAEKDSAGKATGIAARGIGSHTDNHLSSLQKLALFQVASRVENPSSSKKFEFAQCIGRTKDGSIVWFFPRLHESLFNDLGLQTHQSEAIGIVAARRFSPGQLFLIDEVMKEVPHLAYHVETRRTNEYPFIFHLSGPDPDEIINVLKEIYVRFNRRTIQGITSYFNGAPTRFLVQNLRLANQEAVAVLEGVTAFDSIGLLDRWLKQFPCNFRHQIEPGYLLLQGEQETIKNMITMIKQEADRLYTS